MLVGLIFRETVKDKRSILSWRERGKDVLPSHVRGVDIRPVTGTLSSVLSREEKASDDPSRAASNGSSSRSGMGFGRQGERGAGLRGTCDRYAHERLFSIDLAFFLIIKVTFSRNQPNPLQDTPRRRREKKNHDGLFVMIVSLMVNALSCIELFPVVDLSICILIVLRSLLHTS